MAVFKLGDNTECDAMDLNEASGTDDIPLEREVGTSKPENVSTEQNIESATSNTRGRVDNGIYVNEPTRLLAFGVADNKAFYNQWVRSITDPPIKPFIVRNLHYGIFNAPFLDQLLPTAVYLLSWGKMMENNPAAAIEKDGCIAMTAAELLYSMIDSTITFPDEARSRALFEEVVWRLQGSPKLAIVTDVNAASFALTMPADLRAEDEVDAAFQARLAGEYANQRRSFEMTYHVFIHMVDRTMRQFQVSQLTVLATIYCAIVKRGNVSNGFIQKICDAVMADLNQSITISSESIRIFYSKFSLEIDDENIHIVLRHLDTIMPQEALRLRLTLMQGVGSGLTALIVIGKAILTYPDFYWDQIAKIYSDEWDKWQLAANTVQHNSYYGFRRNLGIVRSTLYKNLAWVAKELLIRVGGETSLRKYAGWTRKAREQPTMDQLLNDYEVDRTRRLDERPPNESQRFIDAIKTVRLHASIYT